MESTLAAATGVESSCTAVFLVFFGLRAEFAADGRGFCRAGPACGAELSLEDELLDADDPFEAAEPVESADATAGTEAIAAPTPSATAEAPTQVNILRWAGEACFGAPIPPNSAGSMRTA
ncbi:hypothetical protein [Mycolicibacterium sphagni]|uniref:hypothetical protein n=1 Tax=Mycolicibacterium sphagni TaxID=1786 RepID=UPI0013FD6DA7|nr:hypothetical protein [Mycolicibacterium sphagni]